MTRTPRTTISIDVETAEILERRGGKKDRRRGSWNLTSQLRRTVVLYEAMLVESDPRKTQGMSEAHYRFIVSSLPNPTELSAFHIHRLGSFLLAVPTVVAAAARASIDLRELCGRIDKYPYAEKAHLADAAQIDSAAQAKPASEAADDPARPQPAAAPRRSPATRRRPGPEPRAAHTRR